MFRALSRRVVLPPVQPIVNCRIRVPVRRLTPQSSFDTRGSLTEDHFQMKNKISDLEKKLVELEGNNTVLAREDFGHSEMYKIVRALVYGSTISFCVYTWSHSAPTRTSPFVDIRVSDIKGETDTTTPVKKV